MYTGMSPQEILQFLLELDEYLDNRADVDDGVPNAEMRLLTQLRNWRGKPDDQE